MNSPQKSDYENSPSQISYPNLPVVAQPMTNQMMPITQPMCNMGHQIVQTPYGQTTLLPSNAMMLSSTQGQIYAHTTPSAQPGSYPVQPSNAVPKNPYSAQSVPLHSNVNQMPSQSATTNSTVGQVISTESEKHHKAPQAVTQPFPAVTSNYQKPLPPINKPQNEPAQTDGGDSNAINDLAKPEIQQNVDN